jgi:hypothetical protein
MGYKTVKSHSILKTETITVAKQFSVDFLSIYRPIFVSFENQLVFGFSILDQG